MPSEAAPRLVWERSVRDRYRHPGNPLLRSLPNGERVLWQNGNSIYLAGSGASPAGDYPFLDRFDLETSKTERLGHQISSNKSICFEASSRNWAKESKQSVYSLWPVSSMRTPESDVQKCVRADAEEMPTGFQLLKTAQNPLLVAPKNPACIGVLRYGATPFTTTGHKSVATLI